ncbi:unnamed protein product [Durusdinium trenchii]|uniref:Uncharacterized protein n=1 Tax=Durusdinium trenchii TaxID=1381693 RepID=A0ABP0K4V7_9DINO
MHLRALQLNLANDLGIVRWSVRECWRLSHCLLAVKRVALSVCEGFRLLTSQVVADALRRCKCLKRPDLRLLEISKLDLWDFENLAAVVNGFKLPHPNVKMFEKIGKAAARVVKAMAKVSVDQMVHFIATYGQLGILHHLEKLLKQLRDKNWFKTLIAPWNIAKIDEEQILPHVLAAMVRAQEFDVLQEIAEKYKNKDISTQKIVAILTGLSGCEDKLTIKSAFLKKLVDLCRTCPPEIKDMEQIVYVCQKDAGSLNTLIEICHHRNILESIPKQWQELTRCLECLLGPFTDAKLRVPLLEAAFASRLMQALAQCSKPEPEEVVAAGLKFSVEALASMPALAHAIILRIKSLPKRSELERFKTFISNIALSAKHVPTEAGTAELDAWTAAIDKVILEEASNLGTSRSDLSWSLVEMMTMSSNNLPMKIRQELGQAWLSTILARSRRVFWDGLRVLLEPPRPTEALRAMKQELQGHHPETQSPDAKLSDEVTTEQPVQALTTTCSPTSSPTSAPTSVQESAPASAKQSPEPSRPEIERPRSRSRSRSHAPEAALTVSCQNPKFRGSYRRKGTRNGKAAFAKIDDEEVQLFTEKTCWCLGSPTSGWIRHPSNSGGFAPTEGWDDPTLRISWHAPRVTHGSVAAPRAKVANKKPRTGDRVLKGTPMPLVGEPSPSPSPVEQATLVTPQGELKQWLRSASVDGILMQYEERLVDQLDGDMTFLPEFVCEANSEKVGLARIDPAFWEAIQCTKLAHKLQFSKAMIKLKDAPLA